MNHSKSGLFLMELIISILFFSLASAVCIRLFAHSHIISRETVNQNNAITHAQNMAECWYASEGNMETMQTQLDNSILSDDGMSIFLIFDEDWHCPDSNAVSDAFYVAELTSTPSISEDGLSHAFVSVYPLPDSVRGNWRPVTYMLSSTAFLHETIYTLELHLHVAERRGSLE